MRVWMSGKSWIFDVLKEKVCLNGCPERHTDGGADVHLCITAMLTTGVTKPTGATHPADAHHLTWTRTLYRGEGAYLFAVLQTLQHCQVVGPGVLGTEAGQVLPAGLLFRQLPTGRPSRLWGPSGCGCRCILRRRISGSQDGRVVKLGRAAGSLQAEDGAETAEAHGRQQQQQLSATVRRHLHSTVKLVLIHDDITSGQRGNGELYLPK